jgi:predicted lysophospholipase L1 biosynthesis ABC-type transport system permease subunit
MYIPENATDFKTNQHMKWLTVVGVVREVRLEDLARTLTFGTVYFPAAQKFPRGLSLILKTAGEPGPIVKTLRGRIRELDPEMPLDDIRPMNEYVVRSLIQRRAVMLLASSFGIVSLFLAAVGIYGVLAFLVTQRFREIGIRIALGSTSFDIFGLVLREGIVLVVSGLVLGFTVAASLQQVLQSQVYGLAVMNPSLIGIVGVILSVIALFASSIPARRATRVDPVIVLNQQ